MIKVPQKLLDSLKRKREAHENADWRKSLSISSKERLNEFHRIRNYVSVKKTPSLNARQELLSRDVDGVRPRPQPKLIHLKPQIPMQQLHDSFGSSNQSAASQSASTRNPTIVRFRPNEPAMKVDLAAEKQQRKAQLAREARLNGQDDDSVIDILDDVISERDFNNSGVMAEDNSGVFEQKPKKKYKLDRANEENTKPKSKSRVKTKATQEKVKKHPDERMWRMSRARKQMIFLLQCEVQEEGDWRLLVRGNSGLNYSITIGRKLFCSCPDFSNQKKPCKHLYYILNYVAEVDKIIDEIPSCHLIDEAPLFQILRSLRQRLAYWVTPKQVIDLNIPQLQKHTKKLRGCQICFKRLGKAVNLETCSRCKVRYHRVCIKAFLEFGGVCPICKDLFEKDDPSKQNVDSTATTKKSKKEKQLTSKQSHSHHPVMPVRSDSEEDPLAFLEE